MEYVVVRLNNDVMNLSDLYNHYDNNITFKMEYVLSGMDSDFSFRIDAELKEVSTNDASLCVGDFEDGAFGFDLFYECDSGKMKYEQFLLKTYAGNLKETLVDEFQDMLHLEKAKKHLRTFYGILNPTFLLNLINQQENIQTLIKDGAINIDFDVYFEHKFFF